MSLGDRLRAWAKRSDTVRRWREQRYTMFVELCSVQPDEQILDVGAGEGSALERFNSTNPIVAVDLETDESDWLSGENVTVQRADGTQLPFPDGSFPVVFSNSVIEHVPKALQPAFAREIRRVGNRYFVQTPNRFFPIEPHYQMPRATRAQQALHDGLPQAGGMVRDDAALGVGPPPALPRRDDPSRAQVRIDEELDGGAGAAGELPRRVRAGPVSRPFPAARPGEDLAGSLANLPRELEDGPLRASYTATSENGTSPASG